MLPTDEEIEETRKSLGVPASWHWFTCATECGDIVWVPADVGDLRVEVVCSSECAQTMIERVRRG